MDYLKGLKKLAIDMGVPASRAAACAIMQHLDSQAKANPSSKSVPSDHSPKPNGKAK